MRRYESDAFLYLYTLDFGVWLGTSSDVNFSGSLFHCQDRYSTSHRVPLESDLTCSSASRLSPAFVGARRYGNNDDRCNGIGGRNTSTHHQ